MNRREFLKYQSQLIALGLLAHSPLARAENWNQFLEKPTALPFLETKKYPNPIYRPWPLQKTPNFQLIKDHIAGVRPYRRNGIRLEVERWTEQNKLIVHNYGHGGAGITLSWGSAEIAVEKLKAESHERGEVAVLGAGVMGLSTAVVLLESGYSVTVYSEKFHPHVTSSVAGGQFSPSLVEIPSQLSLNELLRRSWKRFAPLDEKGVGVSYIPNFIEGSDSSFNSFPTGTIPGGQTYSLRQLPFQGPIRSGSYAWTLLIEPPVYLPWLTQMILQKGAKLRQVKIQSRHDVVQLPENFVINCTGLGSKTLFLDTQLRGMKGQLLQLEPQNLGYLLSFNGGYAFSRSDSVVLGGTYEAGVENEIPTHSAYQQILRKNKAFFGL